MLDVLSNTDGDYLTIAITNVLKHAPITMAYKCGTKVIPVLYGTDDAGRHGRTVWKSWLTVLMSLSRVDALLLCRGPPEDAEKPSADITPDHVVLILDGLGHVFRQLPDGEVGQSGIVPLGGDTHAVLQSFANL